MVTGTRGEVPSRLEDWTLGTGVVTGGVVAGALRFMIDASTWPILESIMSSILLSAIVCDQSFNEHINRDKIKMFVVCLTDTAWVRTVVFLSGLLLSRLG